MNQTSKTLGILNVDRPEVSTPTLLNASRIDALYLRGDQRKWHVTCPQCETEIAFEFAHLKFERKPPYLTHYVCRSCGRPIEHHEKAALVRAGRFIAANLEGLYPRQRTAREGDRLP